MRQHQLLLQVDLSFPAPTGKMSISLLSLLQKEESMFILNGGSDQEPPQPNSVRLLATVFCIGITLGSGLGYGFKQATDLMPSKSTNAVTQKENQNLGLAEYIRLEPGMTLAQVESILDRGVEVERSETTTTYIWRNTSGSSITVVFKNNKLFRKTQVNLI